MTDPLAAPPSLAVRIPIPDLRPFLEGNVLPGVWSFAAKAPGPHVALVSLIHGNEIAGALLLARWLRRGVRPRRGRLSMIFANLDAFARFDPADPTMSRYVDEDMNRLWRRDILESDRDSAELRRARMLRPLIEGADVLLDLHSMLWPSDPLVLSGQPEKARPLALAIGGAPVVVTDAGHPEGPRLLDYAPFADPGSHRIALLVEGGLHWEPETVEVLDAAAHGLLRATGLGEDASPAPVAASVLWEVTHRVVARTRNFRFVQDFRGGTVIPREGTLIAHDGEEEIRTPHDDCMLVMPTPRVLRAHTAVRLARRVG